MKISHILCVFMWAALIASFPGFRHSKTIFNFLFGIWFGLWLSMIIAMFMEKYA